MTEYSQVVDVESGKKDLLILNLINLLSYRVTTIKVVV